MSIVTIGYVVKKRWKEVVNGVVKEKFKEKTISRLFHSESAAIAFKNVAVKTYEQHQPQDEADASFFVTNDISDDGLPTGL